MIPTWENILNIKAVAHANVKAIIAKLNCPQAKSDENVIIH